MLGSIIGAVGSIAGGLFGKSAADKQADLQKKFAQNAISWKVEDAKRAGIHPLAALGANTVSYTPMAVGDMGIGDSMAQMGAGIDRAQQATANLSDRKMSGQLAQLALTRAGLENELLKAQIASTVVRTSAAQVGPPMPTPHVPRAPEMVVGPFTGGINVPPVTSAQSWQDFGGEPGEWYGGVMNLDQMIKANPKLLWNPRVIPRDKPRATRGAYRY